MEYTDFNDYDLRSVILLDFARLRERKWALGVRNLMITVVKKKKDQIGSLKIIHDNLRFLKISTKWSINLRKYKIGNKFTLREKV